MKRGPRGPYKKWLKTGDIPRQTQHNRFEEKNVHLHRVKKKSLKAVRPRMSTNPTIGSPCPAPIITPTNNEVPLSNILQFPSLEPREDNIIHQEEHSDQDNQNHWDQPSAFTLTTNELCQDGLDCKGEKHDDANNDFDEEDFHLYLDMGDDDKLHSDNGPPTERVTSERETLLSDVENSEDSEDSENDNYDSNLFLSVKDRIRFLLLLSTKRRHNLSYAAAEDLIALTDVLSEPQNPQFPTRYLMKSVINEYSCALTVHHVCPQCELYLGILSSSTNCSSCQMLVDPNTNKKNGYYFLYLSVRDQLRSLLEHNYDNILKFQRKEKITRTNYEDINDGKFYKSIVEKGEISFNFFVDGVQVATTSKNSAWPVLLTVNELPVYLRRKFVIMASVWLSKKKPLCNQYLTPFVEESIALMQSGISFKMDGRLNHVSVRPLMCISDSIARPMLRNSTQFNGKFGCGLCYHPGIRLQKGRGYVRSYSILETSYPLRTHEETMTLADMAETEGKPQRGIKGRSILCRIPGFDTVRCIDLDLFHALVNVAKRFTSLWFDTYSVGKEYSIRGEIVEVDRRLMAVTPTLEVSRAPRSLLERSDFRGHEWFYFVIIYSVPILKNILKAKYLNHWSLLVHAISLLMQNSVAKSEVAYAERYLSEFVSGIDHLYGAENVTFSCHLLTHLTRSVEDFGQPFTHSAFIYESFNSEIKNAVKSSNGAIWQICKEIQLKLAIQNLKHDVYSSLSPGQKSYLMKMCETGNKLVAPHEVIGPVSLFGKPKKMNVPMSVVQALRRIGANCDLSSSVPIYDRCSVNGVIYHGKSYTKAFKKNNSVALLDSNEVFQIEFFVVVDGQCYVLGHFYIEKPNQKISDIVLPHLKVLKDSPESALRCVLPAQLCSKLIFFPVKISDQECLNLACINVLLSEMLS